MISSGTSGPRDFIRSYRISQAVSISSCPVRNTRMSPRQEDGSRQTSGMETRWRWWGGGVSLTWRFRQVDLHDRDQTGVQVVRLGFSGVQDLHGERSSRDGENGSFKEVLGELDGVQRGGRHDQLHVFTFLDGLKEARQTFADAGSGQLAGLEAGTFSPSSGGRRARRCGWSSHGLRPA